MSREQVLGKAQVVRENLAKLEQIPQSSYADFDSDFRNVEACLRLLQTSIQALIDMGSHLCARLGLPTPKDSFDILARLEADRRLPAGTAARFAPIIGFRNRIVHLYDRIDTRIVFRILTERRTDLAELLDFLLAIDA